MSSITNLVENKKIVFLLKVIFALFLLFAITLYGLFGPSGIFKQQDINYTNTFIIKKGTNISEIAENLHNNKIISNTTGFILSSILSGNRKKIKHGEYNIPTKASPWEIVEVLSSGKTVKRHFTFTEGQTVQYAVRMLENNPYLSGKIVNVPNEGQLMPETYQYQYGDNRQKIIDHMKKNMDLFLENLKQTYSNNSLLENPHTLLTLASLIEKETAIPGERKRVSAVYLNRLAINMPLQCDPTVIYSLTGGEKLDRPLNYDDLKTDSPYNTYTRKGLPIGPIACPGKESIIAALSPEATQDLYFVANGTGGHNFSTNLGDHNTNVSKWRALRKKNMSTPEINHEQEQQTNEIATATPQKVSSPSPQKRIKKMGKKLNNSTVKMKKINYKKSLKSKVRKRS